MAKALAAGAEAVQFFSDIGELLRVSDQWPANKRIRAGERGGSKLDGCDMGNSPLKCTPERVGGRRLFISTTNGTRALQRIQAAPMVMTAALVNRHAVVRQLLTQTPETLWLVGSGWEGSFSLEDTVCAGAIVSHLLTATSQSLVEIAGNDEVFGAIALYEQWQDRLGDLLRVASHGQRLLALNGDRDLEYCAQTDILDILPRQEELGVLVAS